MCVFRVIYFYVDGSSKKSLITTEILKELVVKGNFSDHGGTGAIGVTVNF